MKFKLALTALARYFYVCRTNNEIMFGQGFHVRPLVFNNFIYSGLDGLNENSHNYLNIFIRGGIFGILLFIFSTTC